MSKRLAGILLACVMLFSMMQPVVIAAGDSVIQVGEATLDLSNPAAEAKVEISLQNNPGIIGTKFKIIYDADALSVKDVAAQEVYPDFPGLKHDDINFKSDATGEQKITFNFNTGASTDYKGNGPIAAVIFQATSSTAEGDYTIGIEYEADDGNTINAAGDDVDTFNAVAGVVHVIRGHVEKYDVNVAASTNGSVTANPTSAAEGANVTLTVSPANNYVLEKLTVDEEDVTASVSNNTYSFTMPAKDVEVTASFRESVPIIANVTFKVEGGSWNDDSTTDKTAVVTGQAGSLTLTADQIPAVGNKPDASHITSGKWDTNPATASITDGMVFTYTYDTGTSGPCYVATSVYGSYDAPEVWTLRQYRDEVLGSTWYGRLFIKAYYATSPTLVKWFGNTEWFQNFFRARLDQMVDGLQAEGFTSAPYEDINW